MFDPWQFTAGSGRMYAPVIEQCFLWFLLIAAAAQTYRPTAKAITMALLLAGMLTGLNTRRKEWIPVWNSAKVSAYEEIAAHIDHAVPGRKPMACMIGDHFAEMSDYSAAIYRASHKLLPLDLNRIPDFCDAVFVAAENAPPDAGQLTRQIKYTLEGRRYILFLRPR